MLFLQIWYKLHDTSQPTQIPLPPKKVKKKRKIHNLKSLYIFFFNLVCVWLVLTVNYRCSSVWKVYILSPFYLFVIHHNTFWKGIGGGVSYGFFFKDIMLWHLRFSMNMWGFFLWAYFLLSPHRRLSKIMMQKIIVYFNNH